MLLTCCYRENIAAFYVLPIARGMLVCVRLPHSCESLLSAKCAPLEPAPRHSVHAFHCQPILNCAIVLSCFCCVVSSSFHGAGWLHCIIDSCPGDVSFLPSPVHHNVVLLSCFAGSPSVVHHSACMQTEALCTSDMHLLLRCLLPIHATHPP